MEQTIVTPFTGAQIQQLKQSYASLERIDPCGKDYSSLIKLLDTLPLVLLKQLATSEIRFVSPLAANRVRQQGAA